MSNCGIVKRASQLGLSSDGCERTLSRVESIILDHSSSGPELTMKLLPFFILPMGMVPTFAKPQPEHRPGLEKLLLLEPRSVLFRPNFYPLFPLRTHAMQSESDVEYNINGPPECHTSEVCKQ